MTDNKKEMESAIAEQLKLEFISCDPSYIKRLIQSSDLLTKEAKNDLLHYALYAAKEARKAKRRYYAATTFTIAVPLIVSILQMFPQDSKGVITISCAVLSTSVSFVASVLSVFKFHDKWVRYRNYTETLIAKMIIRLHITPEDTSQNPVDAILEDLTSLNEKHMKQWLGERARDHQTKQN